MNKYIIPYCNIQKSKVGNHIIIATSLTDCKDRLMFMYKDYSDSDDWDTFKQDLNDKDILIGKITDIEEL